MSLYYVQTYDGMIIGEHSRDTDLDVRSILPLHYAFLFYQGDRLGYYFLLQVNPVRAKELTNVRAAGKDENVKLSPPRLVCIFLPFLLLFFNINAYLFFNLRAAYTYSAAIIFSWSLFFTSIFIYWLVFF